MSARPGRHQRKRGLSNRDGRFCWTRIPWPNGWGATWHLFRRSEMTGVWHTVVVPIDRVDRRVVAERLAAARRQLLAKVDAIDLELMGLTA